MHLLATTSGVIDGGTEAVDLSQSPADILVLSAADSELASLARAHDQSPCPLRLANLLQLQHPMSVDLYIDKTIAHARLVVLRILGGAGYWRYGLDQLEAIARERGIKLCVLPGDSLPDPELTRRSTLPPHHCERLRQYLVSGGAEMREPSWPIAVISSRARRRPRLRATWPRLASTAPKQARRRLPSSSTAPFSKGLRPHPSMPWQTR
jgi:cobalamin biosynthesis Mg chelatase CobN